MTRLADLLPDPAPSAEERLLLAEQAAEVRRAVAALPEAERRVIELQYGLDGAGGPLPLEAIAVRLQYTTTWIYKLRGRAFARLRCELRCGSRW